MTGMQLEGKRIIVTGGAQGMGESTVRAFAREGAQVVSFDIKESAGRSVATEATRTGPGSVRFSFVDVSDHTEVTEAVRDAAATLGGLDVLVNIAGVQRAKPAHELTPADLDFLFGINLRGTVYTNQAAFAVMREAGTGAILNFGSDAGLNPIAGLAGYSATKGAVMSWTRTVADEWGRQGIRVNSVVPAIATPMTDAGTKDRGERYAKVPLGGWLGDPDRDFAPVMVFLAGDGARFINGQIIAVNGGLGMVR
ncbi:SDR family NAD(P)-dependent oxidoreductase [Amycolatopsis sp.]|uniref:SDR family NAD(P)-dependent oxidoreductase n=1 Tax=Amycolatopsis sp. TaxID=37632 RepID=UPI002BE64E47|nr:SDR family NAD(P)-dependent oxidoreductase [Amycolatopsis sp.]HVV09274.1 SDR family NAD(P)-dependent oxidoreductase [Amycolatopsis sp.]